MKKMNLLRQLLITGLLIGMLAPVFAQELYLPATSKSKEAKVLYTEAMDAFYDVEFARLNKLATKALEADPNFFMGYFLQLFSGDKVSRKASLEKLSSYDGKMNKGEKVIKQLSAKMLADAKYDGVAESRELVKLYPKNIFAKTMLAYNLGASDDTREEALAVLDECLALKADAAFVYNTKGYLYLQNKDFDNAEEAFNMYVKMASDKANPYDSQGDYLMATKQYAKAAKVYKKAYEINSDFAFSKTKYEEAKWMVERETIAKDVKMQIDKLVADYNSKDMAKYVSHYLNGPEFCFVLNGDAFDSYNEFVKQVNQSAEKYTSWKVEIQKERIEVPAKNIATVTQIFVYTGTPNEGDVQNVKGSFTSVWRNKEGKWKVVQAINTNPLKE